MSAGAGGQKTKTEPKISQKNVCNWVVLGYNSTCQCYCIENHWFLSGISIKGVILGVYGGAVYLRKVGFYISLLRVVGKDAFGSI